MGALVKTQDATFKMMVGETLLEGLERTGHRVEYQCRSGYCGACRMTLSKGRVEYMEVPLAHVRPHEVLPCCSRPVGSVEVSAALGF